MDTIIWRCDLQPQARDYLPRLLELTQSILASGRYVLADHVATFERAFASYLGVENCVGVANGTDALILALKALGLKHGSEVVTTPFTAIPTISAIIAAGGKPVFADIDPQTYLIDVAEVARAVSPKTGAIVPVHLFAQMVDIEKLRTLVPSGIPILEDAAQAHGCRLRGRLAGTIGDMAAFSFYPTKNLGGYGDGGAITVSSRDMADRLRLLRNYGKKNADDIVLDGVNSRLDEIQAAFLSLKLPDLESMNQRRRQLAGQYATELTGLPILPPAIAKDSVPNFHVYVVKVLEKRDALKQYLWDQHRIQTDIFYPFPHHLQPALKRLGYKAGDFPNAERVGMEVLALPMYPELGAETVQAVCRAIRAFFRGIP